MQRSNFDGSLTLRAARLTVLGSMLAIGVSAMAWTGEALAWTGQPLAYVTNSAVTNPASPSGTVSVIDTGDNTVVDTVQVGFSPRGVAVAPDGKHVYVANYGQFLNDGSVSVIETLNETDTVVATIPVGGGASGVAVTPDGTHVYVTNALSDTVSVIDTTTNTVVQTIPVGSAPLYIAVTPDGKTVYVSNVDPYTSVSVIDTATNTVVKTVGVPYSSSIAVAPDGTHVYVASNVVGPETGGVTVFDKVLDNLLIIPLKNVIPTWIAVAPDGKRLYVASVPFLSGGSSSSVLVIDTATNAVTAVITVGPYAQSIAVTPDGTRAYVTLGISGAVSVIETATNTVVATLAGFNGPDTVATVPPPPQSVPFLSFKARLGIDLDRKPKQDSFDLRSEFILSRTASNGIHPDAEPVKLQVGRFITTIPAGSFRKRKDRSYTYEGIIDGVWLEAKIEPTGSLRYAFHAEVKGANLSGTTNPVQVSLGVGDDAGLTTVKAHFDRDRQADKD